MLELLLLLLIRLDLEKKKFMKINSLNLIFICDKLYKKIEIFFYSS